MVDILAQNGVKPPHQGEAARGAHVGGEAENGRARSFAGRPQAARSGLGVGHRGGHRQGLRDTPHRIGDRVGRGGVG